MISIQTQQILVPRKVYLGDTAELRCTFSYKSDFLQALVQNGKVSASSSGFLDSLNAKDYEIKDLEFSQIGINYYQLTITFVPWKTGEILLPAYDLKSGFSHIMEDSQSMEKENLIVEFLPFNIVSLVEQTNSYTVKEAQAPLLLPGTSYKLYSGLIIGIVLLITIIRLIINRNSVKDFIRNSRNKSIYRRNKRRTIKLLYALEYEENLYVNPPKLSKRKAKKMALKEAGKEKMSSVEFSKYLAGKIQHILRKYLEIRFGQNYSKAVTSEFLMRYEQYVKNYEVFGGKVNEKKLTGMLDLIEVFKRTDFIRYSAGSFGGQNIEFSHEEFVSFMSNIFRILDLLEIPELTAEQLEFINEEDKVLNDIASVVIEESSGDDKEQAIENKEENEMDNSQKEDSKTEQEIDKVQKQKSEVQILEKKSGENFKNNMKKLWKFLMGGNND